VDLCESDGTVFLPWAPLHEAARLAPMAEAARRLGTAPEQIALAWLLGRSPQILVIPGSGSPEHVAANIAAAALPVASRRRAASARPAASATTEAAAPAFAPVPKL
jgi:pyridoxine 4-dehydrogenase